MKPLANRVRLLLLALAAAVAAAILLSPEAELPPQQVTVGPVPRPAPPPVQQDTAPLTDAEFAERIKALGVLVPGTDTSAHFLFAHMEDSTLSPDALGLITAAALFDSTFRVDMLGSDGPVKRVAVTNAASIEAAIRRPPEGCDVFPDVPLAEPVIAQSWVIAFRAGAAQVVPHALDRVSDSLTDIEAMRLAESIPPDTVPRWENLPAPAKLFAGVPLLPQASRFIIGNDEVMLVEAWRSRKVDTVVAGVASHLNMSEQRLVIGERRAGSSGPFTVAWTRYAAFEAAQASSEAPLMLIRMGRRQQPAIVFNGSYLDGSGGILVTRVGPARWVTAVSWYAGC